VRCVIAPLARATLDAACADCVGGVNPLIPVRLWLEETGGVTNRLFVYGTLAPGRPNEHILRIVPGTWEPATVTGRLIDRGWGADMGFPAIRLSPDGPRVHGQLFVSDALGEHWQRLDEFEGDAYERVLTRAQLQDEQIVEAQIYVVRER
jgi:gamma-glutamylcyclotransferase (GGCT)/AIG2-like uncharacterized protein YtfP